MSKVLCAACHHAIDDAARLCPYCGADPHTGQKIIDTQAILQEVFHPRHVTAAEGVMEFARQRQGVVIALAIVLLVGLLALFHQFVMRRNATAVSDSPAVPLTDVADLSNQSDETQRLPMPELQFQYDGNPKTMRTYIVEPGAVAPQQSGGQPPSAVHTPQQSGTPASASAQPAKAGAPQPQQ
jgi:hypothetical protein